MKLAIIPIAALLMIPSWARADEIPQGYTLNEQGIVVPIERTRIMKAAWLSSCGKNITPRECRAIKRKDEQRERSKRSTRTIRERVYVAQPREEADENTVVFRKRCWGHPIRAKGAQRPGKGWATRVAKEAWQREVRYDAGEAYLTWNRAKKVSGDQEPGITCNESSISTIGVQQYRCEAKAIPCKAN